MTPRLFLFDDWTAVQTSPDVIELFTWDNEHYCQVTWVNEDVEVSHVDRPDLPWDGLKDIFEGR